MAINAKLFVINGHNPEFRGMMERIAVAIRENDSAAIDAVRADLVDAGMKISVSYLPDSDRIQLIVEGNRPLLFQVVDYLPPEKLAAEPAEAEVVSEETVEQVPNGEDAQPGDN
jgi:hypothetical protein